MTVAGNSNSNNDIGRLALRILQWQAGVALAAAAVAALGWGRRAGLSALAGGAIGLIANLYMTLRSLRAAKSAGDALGRVLMGQMVKVAITVGLFVAAARFPGLVWPAMLIGYIATLIAFWWVPFRWSGREA